MRLDDLNLKDAMKCLDAVLSKAFPEWEMPEDTWLIALQGVRFDYVPAGTYDWQSRFGGISLKINDRQSHIISRRVLIKDGDIDLEKIRSKHAELKELLAIENEARDQIRQNRQNQDETCLRVREAVNFIENEEVRYNGRWWYVQLSYLTEAQVMAIMQAVHEIKTTEL